MVARQARVLDRSGVVGIRDAGFCGAFPQHAHTVLSIALLLASGTGPAQLGGNDVAGRGSGRGAGAFGAFGRPDHRGDGLASDLGGVGSIGHGVQRVEVVAGDHVCNLFAVARERLTQMGSHGQMAGLAVPAGQRVVGHLTQHLLGELVAAPFRRERIRGDREHLPTNQVVEAGANCGSSWSDTATSASAGKLVPRTAASATCARSRGVESVKAGGEQAVQRFRDNQLTDVADESVNAVDGCTTSGRPVTGPSPPRTAARPARGR